MIAPKDLDTDRMKRLTAIAAAVLLAGPLASSADPIIFLPCDFKDHQGSRATRGAIDLILNEAKGTVETRVLGFDGYVDNAYFGENTIEFDAVETGIPMVLNRKTRWVVAKGQNNVRVCLSVQVPTAWESGY